MEMNDEDVVHGTDLQKYLNVIGYSEFEVPKPKTVNNSYDFKNDIKKPNCSKTFNHPTQKDRKDFKIYIKLINICIESKLMFKEDISFIKEFIPSDNNKYPSNFTKRNSFILSIVLCTIFSKYYMTAIGISSLWFGYIFVKILFDMCQNIIIKNKLLKTIKSMEKISVLIQNSNNFIRECNNLHTRCNDIYVDKNINTLMYLMMPELKNVLMTTLQDLINHLIYNISEVHTYFPLKKSVSNVVYLYLTDCNIDVKDTSLENIYKAKYTYFLLQSEFLKQLALCFCPILWKPESSSQINHLFETIQNIEKVYSNLYSILHEEYNMYLLFKNNIKQNIQPRTDINTNSDLKMKIYTVRQSLQTMMVHVRYLDDLIHNSSNNYVDDINSTLNILLKEASVYNKLISALQIYILKTNKDNKNEKITQPINNECIEKVEHRETESINKVCEDELFIGVSEKSVEAADNTFCDEVIFDKSNNYNLMLELNIALKNKQIEWNAREYKLLEKHPQLIDLFNEEDSDKEVNLYTNKTCKKALDMLPNENYSIQPTSCFANEIATIARKWNTGMESFGDDTDSDS